MILNNFRFLLVALVASSFSNAEDFVAHLEVACIDDESCRLEICAKIPEICGEAACEQLADFPFFKCLLKEIEDPNKTKKPKASREFGFDELEERLLQFSYSTVKSDKPSKPNKPNKPNKPSRLNKPNKPIQLQPENNGNPNYFRGSRPGSD
jgi:hypothetical protein